MDKITASLVKGDDMKTMQENMPGETGKQVRYRVSGDRLIHFTALRSDPQVISSLIDQCFDIDNGVLTGTHTASILRNALDFNELLGKAEGKAGSTPNTLSSIRGELGAVEGTQDSALHFAATYSTKEEFARVMATLTRVAEGSESWDDFGIDYEFSYLFRLENANGETVLHRAAAMSNFAVVSYICEHAPDVACQLDSMSRSTLWHAACGGDDRIIYIIDTALKSSKWAPTVDYPDDNGLTPLHVACREGHAACVTALLDLGASPLCAAQSSGLTPIHYASLFGHSYCLSAMAEHLDPGARSGFMQAVWMEDGESLVEPIHLAASNGWHLCVRLLLRYGSPMKPLASVMCIVRDSPSQSAPIPIDQSISDSPGGTGVQVQVIRLSTPREVAAKRGWKLVVDILEDLETLTLGGSSTGTMRHL